MNKELNLCEILKGHVGEIFYSPLLGDVRINISGSLLRITKATERRYSFLLNNNGKINKDSELMLFPSKDQRDWDKWIKEHKKVTYDDIEKCLAKQFWCGIENTNCTSKKQLEKLIAINKLMNVQKYIEKGWQPNWSDLIQDKFFILWRNERNTLEVSTHSQMQTSNIYFSSKENAHKAIEILGEDVIRIALTTDW